MRTNARSCPSTKKFHLPPPQKHSLKLSSSCGLLAFGLLRIKCRSAVGKDIANRLHVPLQAVSVDYSAHNDSESSIGRCRAAEPQHRSTFPRPKFVTGSGISDKRSCWDMCLVRYPGVLDGEKTNRVLCHDSNRVGVDLVVSHAGQISIASNLIPAYT